MGAAKRRGSLAVRIERAQREPLARRAAQMELNYARRCTSPQQVEVLLIRSLKYRQMAAQAHYGR